MVFSAVVLVIGLALGLLFPGSFAAAAAAVIISEPNPATHDYKVAVAHFQLANTAHKDIHATAEDQKIMISLFMPVHKNICMAECESAYMPADTARVSNAQFFNDSNVGVFEKMAYMTCCKTTADSIDASKYPVVFLEPQVGTSRLIYTTLARFMSANGIAVVLTDHPGDSSIVEFTPSNDTPTFSNNGTILLNPFEPTTSWNATITQTLDSRIQDINFVLQQLTSLPLLSRHFPTLELTSPLDTSSYAIVGHGIGGTVATTLNILDARVRFSINLSGTAPLLQQSNNAQIYFFGHTNFTRNHDIHWPETWSHLTGRATEFELQDSDIFDFTDLPWLVDWARKEGGMSDLENARGLGSLGPWAFHVMACFVEGVLRVELLRDWTAVSRCFGFFDQMVPYAAQAGVV